MPAHRDALRISKQFIEATRIEIMDPFLAISPVLERLRVEAKVGNEQSRSFPSQAWKTDSTVAHSGPESSLVSLLINE